MYGIGQKPSTKTVLMLIHALHFSAPSPSSSSSYTQVLAGWLVLLLNQQRELGLHQGVASNPPKNTHTHTLTHESNGPVSTTAGTDLSARSPFISSLLSLHLLLIFHPLCLQEPIETLSVFLTSIEVSQLQLSFPPLVSCQKLKL